MQGARGRPVETNHPACQGGQAAHAPQVCGVGACPPARCASKQHGRGAGSSAAQRSAQLGGTRPRRCLQHAPAALIPRPCCPQLLTPPACSSSRSAPVGGRYSSSHTHRLNWSTGLRKLQARGAQAEEMGCQSRRGRQQRRVGCDAGGSSGVCAVTQGVPSGQPSWGSCPCTAGMRVLPAAAACAAQRKWQGACWQAARCAHSPQQVAEASRPFGFALAGRMPAQLISQPQASQRGGTRRGAQHTQAACPAVALAAVAPAAVAPAALPPAPCLTSTGASSPPNFVPMMRACTASSSVECRGGGAANSLACAKRGA